MGLYLRNSHPSQAGDHSWPYDRGHGNGLAARTWSRASQVTSSVSNPFTPDFGEASVYILPTWPSVFTEHRQRDAHPSFTRQTRAESRHPNDQAQIHPCGERIARVRMPRALLTRTAEAETRRCRAARIQTQGPTALSTKRVCSACNSRGRPLSDQVFDSFVVAAGVKWHACVHGTGSRGQRRGRTGFPRARVSWVLPLRCGEVKGFG